MYLIIILILIEDIGDPGRSGWQLEDGISTWSLIVQHENQAQGAATEYGKSGAIIAPGTHKNILTIVIINMSLLYMI